MRRNEGRTPSLVGVRPLPPYDKWASFSECIEPRHQFDITFPAGRLSGPG